MTENQTNKDPTCGEIFKIFFVVGILTMGVGMLINNITTTIECNQYGSEGYSTHVNRGFFINPTCFIQTSEGSKYIALDNFESS